MTDSTDFPHEAFANVLQQEGAHYDRLQGVIHVSPGRGIAIPFGGVSGQSAHIAAGAVRALTALAAAKDKIDADQRLTDAGRDDALNTPSARAGELLRAADSEISLHIHDLQEKLQLNVAPPPLPGDAHGQRSDDREIRTFLRTVEGPKAAAMVANDPVVQMAVLRGPQIGIPAMVIEAARENRLALLRSTAEFQAKERALEHAQNAAEIIRQAKEVAGNVRNWKSTLTWGQQSAPNRPVVRR